MSHDRSRCDLLSVALSLGSPPPGVIRHRVSVEPGLSSIVHTHRRGRPTLWSPPSTRGLRVFQEQAHQYRTAFAINDAIYHFGAETALKSRRCGAAIIDDIAISFECEEKRSIAPRRIGQCLDRSGNGKATRRQCVPIEQFAGVILTRGGNVAVPNDVAGIDIIRRTGEAANSSVLR
jgi:hypothetical protein